MQGDLDSRPRPSRGLLDGLGRSCRTRVGGTDGACLACVCVPSLSWRCHSAFGCGISQAPCRGNGGVFSSLDFNNPLGCCAHQLQNQSRFFLMYNRLSTLILQIHLPAFLLPYFLCMRPTRCVPWMLVRMQGDASDRDVFALWSPAAHSAELYLVDCPFTQVYADGFLAAHGLGSIVLSPLYSLDVPLYRLKCL